MKLFYFKDREQYRLGIVTEKGVLDVDAYQQYRGQKIFSATNLNNRAIE